MSKLFVFMKYFLWQSVREFFLLRRMAGGFFKKIRRPTSWLNWWIVSLALYVVFRFGSYNKWHLAAFLLAFIIITVWYNWVRGDWRKPLMSEDRTQQKFK